MLNQYNRTQSKPTNSYLVILGLLIFIGLAVVPYGWVANQLPLFARVTNFLFKTELAHVIGHSAIFALMGTAVLHIFPKLMAYPTVYFGLMGMIGIAQEALQLLSFKHRPVSGDDLFDLAVDMLAATAVYFFIKRRVQKRGM